MGNDPANTRGRRLLAKVIGGGISQGDVARTIGAPQPSVSQWAGGKRRPSPKYRRRLSMRFGIPETDWMTREEFDGERISA